ncbi:trp operon leader peptide [Streptomyces tamarix]
MFAPTTKHWWWTAHPAAR